MIMPCLGARRKPSSTNISSFTSRQNSISNDKFTPPTTANTTTTALTTAASFVAASIRSSSVSRSASITSHQSAAAATAVAQIKQECNELKSMVSSFSFFVS